MDTDKNIDELRLLSNVVYPMREKVWKKVEEMKDDIARITEGLETDADDVLTEEDATLILFMASVLLGEISFRARTKEMRERGISSYISFN